MNNVRPSPTESQLLRRIQRRLVGWFLLALVGLNIVVVALTYGALDYRLTTAAHQAILTNWHDTAPNTVQQLVSHDPFFRSNQSHHGERPRVATWVVAANGRPLYGPRLAEGLTVPIRQLLPVSRWQQQLPHRTVPLWRDVAVGPTRVMVGAMPLHFHGRYVGALESVYWMGNRDEMLGDLLRIDFEIGAVAFLIMLAAAYWLSGRSLEPVRQSLSRQRAFVHDVSHEIRTPLAILKSSLELAHHEDPEDMQRALSDSLQEVDYLTRLVDDLATLARVDSGVTPLSLQEFSLTQLIADVISRVTPQASLVNVRLWADTPKGVLIWADPTRMRQLLLIFLDNAIKYNRHGGEVGIHVAVTKRGIRLRISDTGRGISPEDLPRVFDRFYRSRTAGRTAPGTGLGLAIAAWIVHAHHGTLSVESRLGHGTEFIVSLPYLVDSSRRRRPSR